MTKNPLSSNTMKTYNTKMKFLKKKPQKNLKIDKKKKNLKKLAKIVSLKT